MCACAFSQRSDEMRRTDATYRLAILLREIAENGEQPVQGRSRSFEPALLVGIQKLGAEQLPGFTVRLPCCAKVQA